MALLCFSLLNTSLRAEIQGSIQVEYQNPEKFIDIMDSGESKTRSIKFFQSTMNRFFNQVETKYLKPGHRLKLVITDVDRAGDIRYDITPDMRDMRILRDVVRVRIDFKYTLLDGSGAIIKQGTESLREFYTLNTIKQRSYQNERLYFEKQLMESWLTQLEK
jgi:hypothetical protein